MRWILFLLVALNLEGGAFHAILVADTLVEQQEVAGFKDLRRMRRYLQGIAKDLEMPFYLYEMTGERLSYPEFYAALTKVNVEEDDTVMFCFWGHGRQCHKEIEPWPCFYFSKTSAFVSMEDVVAFFRAKSPRLFVCLADCCSSVLDEEIEMARLNPDQARINRLEALYKHARGEVLISSAQPGTFAYAGKNGHFFTTYFLLSSAHLARQPKPLTWEAILELTSKHVARWQTPCWEIHLD